MTKWRKHGEGLIRGICLVQGCDRLQRYRGKNTKGLKRYSTVCDMHHCLKYGMPYMLDAETNRKNFFLLKHTPNKKCEECGWDKAYCDRHRIKPELGYIPGNVRVLCPNCHRIETVNSHKGGRPPL